jgi:hypothetical protein
MLTRFHGAKGGWIQAGISSIWHGKGQPRKDQEDGVRIYYTLYKYSQKKKTSMEFFTVDSENFYLPEACLRQFSYHC